MSIATIESPIAARASRAGLARRMVGAEFLKVRKRRGLVLWALILSVGTVVGAGVVLAVLHASDPAKYGPAGGVPNLANAGYVLSSLGVVAAVLVGATMGAGDLQAGVFRDLVATGRSRFALSAARIPGGLALLAPLVAGSWAIASVGSVLLAGSSPRPGLSIMIEGGVWALAVTTVMYLVALGLASLAGSRSTTIGVLLAWQFAVTPVVLSASKLGVLREAVLQAGFDRTLPAGLVSGIRPDPVSASMSIGAAIATMAAWALVSLAAGAWRTMIREA